MFLKGNLVVLQRQGHESTKYIQEYKYGWDIDSVTQSACGAYHYKVLWWNLSLDDGDYLGQMPENQ